MAVGLSGFFVTDDPVAFNRFFDQVNPDDLPGFDSQELGSHYISCWGKHAEAVRGLPEGASWVNRSNAIVLSSGTAFLDGTLGETCLSAVELRLRTCVGEAVRDLRRDLWGHYAFCRIDDAGNVVAFTDDNDDVPLFFDQTRGGASVSAHVWITLLLLAGKISKSLRSGIGHLLSQVATQDSSASGDSLVTNGCQSGLVTNNSNFVAAQGVQTLSTSHRLIR